MPKIMKIPEKELFAQTACSLAKPTKIARMQDVFVSPLRCLWLLNFFGQVLDRHNLILKKYEVQKRLQSAIVLLSKIFYLDASCQVPLGTETGCAKTGKTASSV